MFSLSLGQAEQKLEDPPTAPGREIFYEEIIPDPSAGTNGTNDGQQQGNNPNPNGDTTPSQGAQIANGDNSDSPPGNGSTGETEMSMSELFKQLTARDQKNNEEIK